VSSYAEGDAVTGITVCREGHHTAPAAWPEEIFTGALKGSYLQPAVKQRLINIETVTSVGLIRAKDTVCNMS
jgi:hypothetical protein